MIHDSAVTTYVNPHLAPWALGPSLSLYVLLTDPRLTDARVPLAHTHTRSEIIDFAHAHPQVEVDNLVDDLAAKQPLGEYHVCLALSDGGSSF